MEEPGLVPKLLTPIAQPSFDSLRTAFVRNVTNLKSHAFLELILNSLELLSLVELLWPLVAWESALREHWGRKITQEEARGKTVGELLSTHGARDTDELTRSFDHFAEAWNKLAGFIDEGGLASARYLAEVDPAHPCREAKKPQLMSRECKVSMCCIDRAGESNEDNMLLRFLKMLGRAQNDLLTETTHLVPDNASLQALHAGGRMICLGNKTPLLQLVRTHLILNREDSLVSLKESMLAFSCCGATGRRIEYDFAGIEASVASHLLVGTTLVDFEGAAARHLVPFPFGGELHQLQRDNYVGLQLIERAITQQPLPNMDKVRNEPFLQETHQARALLELLELVLHDVTKSRPAPNETLAVFCKSFGHGQQKGSLQRRALDCATIGGVQLLHVRSLYELVEGMVADAVLSGATARERTVPERFSTPLTPRPPSNAETEEKAAYSQELKRFDNMVTSACSAFGELHPDLSDGADRAAKIKMGLLWLEPALKRFIYRELQESSTIDPTHGLCHYVDSFPWQGGDEISFDNAAMLALPEVDFRIEHALALWVELRTRLGGGSGLLVRLTAGVRRQQN